MKKVIVASVFALLLSGAILPAAAQTRDDNMITALKGTPFSALIFYESVSRSTAFVGILMDQSDISEDNLRLVFRLLSDKYPSAPLLESYVYTDMVRPASLIKGEMISADGVPPPPALRNKPKASSRGAYYTRSEKVELFRFDPNYPDDGMKTVILRGKE